MKSIQTILVADDNYVNRTILSKLLGTEFNVITAQNGQETIEILLEKKDRISALLLDIIMPEKNGFDVLEFMSKNGLSHIPVVVMTGDSDAVAEEKALDLGAWDFVTKPYKPKVLFTRLKNAIARSKIDYFSQIKHIAEHDSLTDLYNRRHFFEVVEVLCREHRQEKTAFVRMDINRFKMVNSFWGEKYGDMLLKFMAQSLRSALEDLEWCAYGRIESDVFGFFIPFDKDECDNIINKLSEQLKKYSNEYIIEPCFGVYVAKDCNITAENMFINATEASEECKSNFMQLSCYYNDENNKKLEAEQEIVRRMRFALENNEFVVYFQPKYNVKTQTPYGAEALVRWKTPDGGMISPASFIQIFERNGFIGNLDFYIWDKVCGYMRKWLDMGIEVAPISVNMSRAELANPHLVSNIVGLIEKYNLPDGLLDIELTETAYMDNPDAINVIIEKLHKNGFTVLMDDFGSGYSSLNTLKDIEVDILKVDMKFQTLDDKNFKSKRILASVIKMAQWINMPVVTEGVETKEQYEFIKDLGCEYIQGYYFAKPMPADEYENLIRNSVPIKAENTNKVPCFGDK